MIIEVVKASNRWLCCIYTRHEDLYTYSVVHKKERVGVGGGCGSLDTRVPYKTREGGFLHSIGILYYLTYNTQPHILYFIILYTLHVRGVYNDKG